jgi:putative transposase
LKKLLPKTKKWVNQYSTHKTLTMSKEHIMTQEEKYTILEPVLEALISGDVDQFTKSIATLINLATRLERERVLQAENYERTESRLGYANGFKDKTLKMRLGEVPVKIPQVRGGVDFYPSSIEKGIRSERALKLALAEMYVNGVSTRKVSDIVEKLCGFGVSSSQVSKASEMLDEEIEVWRNREIKDEIPYLVLDATYEKVRMGKNVVSGAILIAYGVKKDGRRTILGVSVSLSEAEVHWREFLTGLLKRGLHGVKMITSDDHAGLKCALNAVFPGVMWQRCQFHLQQNAQKYVTKNDRKKEVAGEIRKIFNAPDRNESDRYLRLAMEKYSESMPKLSEWLEHNIPEGLTVFHLPEAYRKKLRTSNMAERQMKEVKRRTRVAMIFPNEKSLLRLVSSLLMETSEQWETGKVYLGGETG